jgi:flagellar biosynthetic protein FliR
MEIYKVILWVYEKLPLFILISARISMLFSVFVLFRSGYVNNRILIALTVLLSVMTMSIVPMPALGADLFSAGLMYRLLTQVILGFTAGLILNILFDVFVSMGQIISSQVGLGLASLYDPSIGSVTVLTKFYHFFIFVLFLVLDGHLLAIKVILDSFTTFPIDKTLTAVGLFSDTMHYSGIIFSGGMMLSMAVVISVLLINITMAILSRFAPQFNLFSVGLSMSLIMGMIVIGLTINLFVELASRYLQEGLQFLTTTFHGLS